MGGYERTARPSVEKKRGRGDKERVRWKKRGKIGGRPYASGDLKESLRCCGRGNREVTNEESF